MKLNAKSFFGFLFFLQAITFPGPFLLLPVHDEVRGRATYSHHHDVLAPTHVAEQPSTKTL